MKKFLLNFKNSISALILATMGYLNIGCIIIIASLIVSPSPSETAIKLLNKQEKFENLKEQKVYNMLYEASGDGTLEKKELERWCKGKYSKILDWFDDVIKEERDKLVEEGLIETKQTKNIFSNIKYEVTY